jgi:dihydrofolate synthase/folylpolyglutamate synthase
MTYDEAVQYWFGRINYEQKTPQPGDFKLDRMRLLLDRLGHPEERYRIVHLAGSKGKGSTSAMLAAVLRAEGYRVGLFTSPHLVHVEERIQVDGQSITRLELAARLSEIRDVARATRGADGQPLDDGLTFFEIATAVGLLHFAYRRAEWAVLEVGLGGRLDSTNVCRPRAAIITSISFDHQEQLGYDLVSIAREKAGIIKPCVPTISGVQQPEARAAIVDRCAAIGSPLLQLGRDFEVQHEPARIDGEERPAHARVTTWRRTYPDLTLKLVGAHQAANAALVVACLEVLRQQGVPIGDGALFDGLAHVDWPARLEVLSRHPTIVLDCAHNVASAEALRDALFSSFPTAGKRYLVFAVSRDKDYAGMLRILEPMFDQIVMTRFEKNPRYVQPESLQAALGTPAKAVLAQSPADAVALVKSRLTPDDLLCVTGSVFLAGEVRPLFVPEE